jgi:Flp pilus assembly CpaF family ATPase
VKGAEKGGPASAELLAVAVQVRDEVARLLADEPLGETGPARSLRDRAGLVANGLIERRAADSLARGEPALGRDADDRLRALAMDMLFGLGALQPFVDDDRVENLDVNGCDSVYVTYAGGRKEQVGRVAVSDEELIATIRSAAARFGLSERRFDAGQPELDLRLPDGSRLSAVMAVTERPSVSIRRHRLVDHDLASLVELGMLEEELAELLSAAVAARRNVLISGAMNSGKTTLLRAMAAAIPPEERLVTIEQALELGLDKQPERHPDCVAMEARLPNTEGLGGIGMAQLVKRSLRMNASRVIVGEVLGDEVIPMLNAMSQGRSGSMGTIHADSSPGVFRRIAAYAVQAPERLPLEATNLLIAGAIHFVVHLDFAEVDGRPLRHVSSVREVVDADGSLVVSNEIWREGEDGRAVPGAPLSEQTRRALMANGRHRAPRRESQWCSF